MGRNTSRIGLLAISMILTRSMKYKTGFISRGRGCGRTGDAELARFLTIAMGSASELEYHLLLARDLNFLTIDTHETLTTQTVEIKRMLTSLIQKLRAES